MCSSTFYCRQTGTHTLCRDKGKIDLFTPHHEMCVLYGCQSITHSKGSFYSPPKLICLWELTVSIQGKVQMASKRLQVSPVKARTEMTRGGSPALGTELWETQQELHTNLIQMHLSNSVSSQGTNHSIQS